MERWWNADSRSHKELRRVRRARFARKKIQKTGESIRRRKPLRSGVTWRGWVGYADALLARELSAAGYNSSMDTCGRKRHHRAMVPVLILDLSEEEADKFLLTLVHFAGMAESDFRAASDPARQRPH